MKKKALRFASVATAAVIGLSLSACSSSDKNSETSTSASAGPVEPVTLTVYGWKGSEAEPANVPAINAAFEAANPGVTVNYEFLKAGDTINQRLQPELLAGEGPDVFMTDRSSLTTGVENGYLADLSDQPWASTMSDQVAPYVTVDGAVYGAPLEIIPLGLFANMDVLNQAGITEFPTTYDDFIAALAALQAAGLPGLAVPFQSAWADGAILSGISSTLVYSENPAWDDEFMAGNADFSDWTSSVDQLLALDADGYIDLEAGLGIDEWSQGTEDFKAGKSAFLYQGGWNLGDFQNSVPSVQFGPWPATNGTNWANMFSGINWSVNAASKHQDLAKSYIDFFVASENLKGFLDAEAAFTPYIGGESSSNPASVLMSEAAANGTYRLDSTLTWENGTTSGQYGSDLQALILGQKTVDEMLAGWNSFRG